MSGLFSKAFWADTAERMVSTFAQAALAALPVGYLPGASIPWWAALAAGGFAALLCLLKCLAALKVGAPDSASLLPADVDPPQDDGAGEVRTILLFAAGGLLALFLYYFVLVPLLELDPELALPDGTRLSDALAALPEDEQRAERVVAL